MLQMCDFKLGEGDVMPPKENVGPPKAKWHPLRMNECEVMCLYTPNHDNHLRNQNIHQTLAKRMTSKDRGWRQGPPKAPYRDDRDVIMSPSDFQTPATTMSSILYAQKSRGSLPNLWASCHMCGIVTRTAQTKPICPSYEVLRIWEPLDDSLLSITRAKLPQ